MYCTVHAFVVGGVLAIATYDMSGVMPIHPKCGKELAKILDEFMKHVEPFFSLPALINLDLDKVVEIPKQKCKFWIKLGNR